MRLSQRFGKHYSPEVIAPTKAMLYLLYQPETYYNQYTKDENFKTFSLKNRLNNALFHDRHSHIPNLREAIESIDKPWTFNNTRVWRHRLPFKVVRLALPPSTTAEKKLALMGDGNQKPALLKNTEAEENIDIRTPS